MDLRLLKIIFVVLIALLCLAFAVQNVANHDAAYQSFVYVLSNADHNVYPSSFFPSISNPILIWAVVFLVVGFEFLAGLLAARGALDMWLTRHAPAEEFNQSKQFALLGCGLGVIVWLGFFGVLGGGFFQMWQTAVGSASLEGAFQYFISCAAVFIIVNLADE